VCITRVVDAVLFDLFGTLVPNMDPDEYRPCVDEVAGFLGAPRDEFRDLWRATFPDRMRGDLRDGNHVFEHLLGPSTTSARCRRSWTACAMPDSSPRRAPAAGACRTMPA
jgi:hypothetical protein